MASVIESRFLFSLPRWAKLPEEPLSQICFCGRSNVGKSSLLNVLVGRKGLARVSSTPGRTQAINAFAITLRHDEIRRDVWFIDLPGYGYAKAPESVRSQWGPMMKGYLQNNPHLRAAVLLLDLRRTPNDADLELIDLLEEYEVPLLPVATKADKVSSTKRKRHLMDLEEATDIPAEEFRMFSSVTRQGSAELLEDLFHLAENTDSPAPDESGESDSR